MNSAALPCIFAFVAVMFSAIDGFTAESPVEVFVLRDGRSITGVYDPVAGTISVQTGGMTAAIVITSSDIISRSPAPVAPPSSNPPVRPLPPSRKEAGQPVSPDLDWNAYESLMSDIASYRLIAESRPGSAQAEWDGLHAKWCPSSPSVPKGDERALMTLIMPDLARCIVPLVSVRGVQSIYANRIGSSRLRAVGVYGGTLGSEEGVNAALRWFKKHQSPNGMWDAEKYFQNCTEHPKCDPGSLGGHGVDEVNTAMTGYALLCYLGAGYDHKTPNTYQPVVKKGIDYLLNVQGPDGLLGKRNYEHPVATMALAEAYAMTSDPKLRKQVQLAVDIIIKRQNKDPNPKAAPSGLGWDYVNQSRRNDASISGWNIMALKSASAAGINVGNSMGGAKKWLEQAWKANNDGKNGRPDWQKLNRSKGQSLFSYCYTTGTVEFDDKFGHQNMAPVGMVCAVFLGHRAGDTMLETLSNFVMAKQTPKAYPTNTYYMYYNTLGLFQIGGDKWKTWNSAVRDMLVNSQRKGDGCFNGSWDWEGTGFHGHNIGRVLATAYNTLCLEVYYRYTSGEARRKP